jgi:hypothetical protein
MFDLTDQQKFDALVNDLIRPSTELEWIEFKVDNFKPEECRNNKRSGVGIFSIWG